MAKDINKKDFDNATSLKLEIFRESFKEWLPVFIHNPYVSKVFIYDFFAGSGKDISGAYGSPLILFEEARGENQMYCSKAIPKNVVFAFNEKIESKSEELKRNVESFELECLNNCQRHKCVYDYHIGNYDFKEAFNRKTVIDILNNKNYGKFVLLDQYGFKEVDNEVFKRLVSAPKTDFIFFISSSFIKRFREHASVKKYIETNKINFDEAQPKECHRIVAQYFNSLIPQNQEYYLHHFTIKKGTNYYGLIFGTNHTFGMEKFLKVCWQKDVLAGEANFDINNDYQLGTLFYTEENTNKIEKYSEELKQKIVSKEITNNIEALKFTLRSGIQPKVYVDKIEELIRIKKIEINGNFNKRAANIHKLSAKETYGFVIK